MPDHDHTLDPLHDFARQLRIERLVAERLTPRSDSLTDIAASTERCTTVLRLLSTHEVEMIAHHLAGRFPAIASIILGCMYPNLAEDVATAWERHELHVLVEAEPWCPFCFEQEDDGWELDCTKPEHWAHDPVEDPDPALVVELVRPHPYEDNGQSSC